MTSTGPLPADAAPHVAHPLASLSEAEIRTVQSAVTAHGHVTAATRFAYVGLAEPHKGAVLAWEADEGPRPERRARVMLVHSATGVSADAVVSLDTGTLVSYTELDGTGGQAPILDEEFGIVQEIAGEDEQWLAALARRGLTMDDVVMVPLSAGHYGYPEEEGRRIMRTFAFRQDFAGDHPWAHPVDGLTAYIDTARRSVVRLIDVADLPIPEASGNFDDPQVQGPPLEGLTPISITQPEGPSFTVDDERVTWAGWTFRLGFDMREGLVLRDLAFDEGGGRRPVLYRASISEMVVPYADPQPARFWQNYFDTGEYLFGRYTNSLALGCDCLGEIRYLDAVFADEVGNPRRVPNAICMHEEDVGTLWKHTDVFTGAREVRRSRRLVVSFFTTVGNYDYGFYWYLYLDGTIECEAKLTGVLFTSAYPGRGEDGSDYPYATEVAPGLGGPYHQHLFNARLDMNVDGASNVVDEVDVVPVPMGEGNEHGNAFTKRVSRIASEGESGRVAEGSLARTWHISSTQRTNATGRATS